MAIAERKILIPDGDAARPHQNGVCDHALNIRNSILITEDKNGRKPFGRVSRREGEIKGCLVEIIPRDTVKR